MQQDRKDEDTMNEPSISERVYIRWIPDAASEPTSTLVLTSSRRTFIDIRILLPTNPHDPILPNQGGPISRLSWAFAGVSSTTLLPPPTSSPSTAPITHSEWTHWVDSNSDSPASDEGDMYPQADGLHVLEKGAMVNPDTGTLTNYEEMWRDALVEGEKEKWSIVLRLDDAAAKAKGMVVRVGQWCQGIVKVGGEVSVERWLCKDGEWERVARLGRLFLPCGVTFKPEMLEEGRQVTYGDYRWEVEEVFRR